MEGQIYAISQPKNCLNNGTFKARGYRAGKENFLYSYSKTNDCEKFSLDSRAVTRVCGALLTIIHYKLQTTELLFTPEY